MGAPDFPRQFDGNPYREQEIVSAALCTLPFKDAASSDDACRQWSRKFRIAPRRFAARIAKRTSWTNKLLYSESLDNAAWTKGDTTITADATTAPDGVGSMDAIFEAATTAQHKISQAATVAATPQVLSAFAAANGRGFCRLGYTDSAVATFYAYFNLSNHTAAALSAGVTADVFLMPDGSYRYRAYFTPAAGAGTMALNLSADGVNANISYAGDVTKGIYAWGLELKAGTTAGPYVSTTDATRTVSAPDQDREDPLAYLVFEGDPTIVTSLSQTFRRECIRIPAAQTKSVLVPITRPNGSTVGSAAWPSLIANSVVFDVALAVSYAPLYAYLNYYFLSGLNTVYGPIQNGLSSVNSGADTRVTAAAHGLTGTESFVVRNASISAFTLVVAGQYTVIDANTFDILGHNYAATINTSFAKFFRAYTSGTGEIDGQEMQTFYLPGVSPGITTAGDIPRPSPLTDDGAMLGAVIAHTSGYVHYNIVSRNQLPNSQLWQQTVRKINFADL